MVLEDLAYDIVFGQYKSWQNSLCFKVLLKNCLAWQRSLPWLLINEIKIPRALC